MDISLSGEKNTTNRESPPVSLEEGFPGGSADKESACNAGDLSSIPGLGRSPEGRHGNPFQYSCPENPMDGGAWQGHHERNQASECISL